MKKQYRTPFARKIDYSFKEQVVASTGKPAVGTELAAFAPATDACTYFYETEECNLIYNTAARGFNNCTSQGRPVN